MKSSQKCFQLKRIRFVTYTLLFLTFVSNHVFPCDMFFPEISIKIFPDFNSFCLKLHNLSSLAFNVMLIKSISGFIEKWN